MLPADDIQRYLSGTWRMMIGKADGLRMLDISADGFWNSFFAIVIALPPLIVGWAVIANDLSEVAFGFGGRLSIVLRLAVVDLGSWVLPLVVLALAAPAAGIGDRFVHYVVASNWATAIIVWLMLPPPLIRLFLPAATGFATAVSLVLFLLSMALLWRLTNAAINKGPATATAVFGGMFLLSLLVLFVLRALLGLDFTPQVPA